MDDFGEQEYRPVTVLDVGSMDGGMDPVALGISGMRRLRPLIALLES